MKKRNFHCSAACLSLLMFAARVCQAQTLYSFVVGNVRDPSQAVITGAMATLTNTETHQTREAVTNELGGYSLDARDRDVGA